MIDRTKLVALAGLGAALLLSGCAQKDSSVGSDLAPGLNDIYPQDTTLYADTTRFYETQATTGGSTLLYLGHDQGYEADVLLKFNPSSALPDSYLVDSLVVKLYLDSLITAQTSSLPCTVTLLNRSYTWFEIGVTWDDLVAHETNNYLPLDADQYGMPLTSFAVLSSLSDSDSVSFSLPEAICDSLLRAWEWAGNGGKTLHYNNGLYLLADKSQDFLARFASAENSTVSRRPRLEMYVSVIDTSDTTGAAPLDTMLFLYPSADAFIAQSSTTLEDTLLYLGNGVACRSMFFFPVDRLFPTYGVAVHRAEIVLHADTTHELNYSQITEALYLEMQDTTWIQSPDSALTEPGAAVSYDYDVETASVTLNLTGLVYYWITHPGSHQGLMIRSSNEGYDLSRTVFYGNLAADSLKPHLRIVYLEGPPQ